MLHMLSTCCTGTTLSHILLETPVTKTPSTVNIYLHSATPPSPLQTMSPRYPKPPHTRQRRLPHASKKARTHKLRVIKLRSQMLLLREKSLQFNFSRVLREKPSTKSAGRGEWGGGSREGRYRELESTRNASRQEAVGRKETCREHKEREDGARHWEGRRGRIG